MPYTYLPYLSTYYLLFYTYLLEIKDHLYIKKNYFVIDFRSAHYDLHFQEHTSVGKRGTGAHASLLFAGIPISQSHGFGQITTNQ